MSPNRDRPWPRGVFYARPLRWLRLQLAVILVTSSLSTTTPAATGQEVSRAREVADPPPTFVHEVWTVEDGLPVNSINGLLQSRDGYLWAATFDGLVRFDGVRFETYNTGTSEGLPSNRIVELLEAQDGSLWMRTEQKHLVRFQGGEFTHFGADQGLPDNATNVIHEDPEGRVWVGTARGLGYIRDERFVPVAEGTIHDAVSAIASGAGGLLWVGTDNPPAVFRYAAGTVTTISDEGSGVQGPVYSLYEDPSGTLWIGTLHGVYRYRGGRLESVPLPDQKSNVSVREFLASPATETLWIGTQSGVYRLEGDRPIRVTGQNPGAFRKRLIQADNEGHLWFAVRSELYHDGKVVFAGSQQDPISVREINAFLLDHEGSVWIGTGANGLHRLKPSAFTVYSEPEGLVNRNVYTVYEDRSGAVWFGTWGHGLSRLADGVIKNFSREEGYPGFALPVLEDRSGRFWIGLYTGGGGAQECTLPDLSCFWPASLPFGGRGVFAIYEDVAGDIWFGTAAGVFRNGPTGWARLEEKDGAPSAPVRAFRETRDGALWMGTNGDGLVRYADGRLTRITAADGVPGDLIRSLYQDGDGWLWVGTEGRGLVRVDPTRWNSIGATGVTPASLLEDGTNGPVVTVYRVKDGLFDETIHQILEDDYERLWMSTNRGIFWVARAELNAFATGIAPHIHSTGYTERDGLRNREANGGFYPAGIKAHDGRLWFATQDGAVVIDPAKLRRNEVPPPVVIEQVVAEGRSVRAGSLPIELAAGERDLQIDYTALSFIAPENMRFRYRLEGYDRDWVEAGNRRSAFYTKVPPGRYTFRVNASNNDGVWNEEGAALALSVATHFYETKAWYLFLAAVTGLLVVGAVRWRLRALRGRERELSLLVEARTEQIRRHETQLEAQNALLEAQAEKLTELDRVKSHFFANVSHEFRTPLTLTIGPLEDLRSGLYGEVEPQSGRQLDMALRNARRLLRLVNQVLDAAKLESGEMRLRARQADLVSFLGGLAGAFAPLAERRRISLELDAPSETLPVWFDAGALEKVFANLLSNAFKFTPEGGTITLVVRSEVGETDGDHVAVRVTDSGSGIPPQEIAHVFERFHQVDESHTRLQPGTGIGLSLAKEYVELHGGDIRVESREGSGTTFTVTLPLGRGHLRDDQIAEEAWREKPRRAAAARAAKHVPGQEESEPAVASLEVAAEVDTADLAPADGEVESGPSSSAPRVERSAETEEDLEDVTTVLVVDDNAEVRAYIRTHLESTYRVAEATDGADGIVLARALLPDLVISDVMMAGTDGYAVCRALRGSPETDFIPVILLTAKASTESKVAGLEEGADDYVVKPFEMRELEARVASLIASRRRLRERFTEGRLELRARVVDVTSADASYLERVRATIEEHLSDESFGVTELADSVGQDRTHLYRRIRALLDETPSDLIRRLRLEHAARLLDGQAGSVAEVAYAVGFKGVSYFCKCFRDAYGVTPSAYRTDPLRRTL